MAQAVNGTIDASEDAKTKTFLYDTEDKVFRIALLSVALCVLTISGIMMCISYYNRRRSNRAYASTTSEKPLDITYSRRTGQFSNPFRGKEELRENLCIYYIFSNPIPVEDETDPNKPSVSTPLTLEEYAKNPENRITLNPPVFYMEL